MALLARLRAATRRAGSNSAASSSSNQKQDAPGLDSETWDLTSPGRGFSPGPLFVCASPITVIPTGAKRSGGIRGCIFMVLVVDHLPCMTLVVLHEPS